MSAGAASDRGGDRLPDRLRALRAALGLSQEQLGRELQVSVATVNRWERGRSGISPAALARLEALEARTGRLGPAAAQTGALPVALSRFVGRTAELAALDELLGSHRLVCVTGPGGVGKTRLALEVARRHRLGPTATFVDLEPVRDAAHLEVTLAAALKVRDRPNVAISEAIGEALADEEQLLVLDGAEQLRDEVAALARRLLTSAGEVRLLVTTRRVLGVVGEASLAVPPLGLPPVGASTSEINAADAVQLFLTRARERSADFAPRPDDQRLAAELCRRLDGLPLAIELLSGWVGTLSIAEIAERREALISSGASADPSQPDRTLRSVVEVSFALLPERARDLLPALSTFAGPFTIADVVAVADVADDEATALLRELVDGSWLAVEHRQDDTRYKMLDTVRDHLAGRLRAAGEDAAQRRRHAEHFARLALASEDGLAGPESPRWAARLEAANADLELTLWWADETGAAELGLATSAALWRWWLLCGRLTLGRAWLATFLESGGRRRDEPMARALSAAAVLAAENGDYADAVEKASVALEVFRSLGRRELAAFAATVLGSAQRYLGDAAAAKANFEVAMGLRAELGDRRGVSVALNNLALLALDDDDLASARDLFEQSLVLKRQLGDPRSVAIGLANLSDVLIRTGRLAAASAALDEAAALALGLDNRQLIGTIRCNQGDLAAGQGDWPSAERHLRAAVVAYREAGHAHDVVNALVGLGRALAHLGEVTDATKQLREAESLAAETKNPLGLVAARAALAELGEATVQELPDGLTRRQAEVLGLAAAGATNKEIAAELALSVATVERHLANIYLKLQLRGRVEATRYAVEHGLASRRAPRAQR